jgi:hypothetical protein
MPIEDKRRAERDGGEKEMRNGARYDVKQKRRKDGPAMY